jgi:uncharacterized protein DUF6601
MRSTPFPVEHQLCDVLFLSTDRTSIQAISPSSTSSSTSRQKRNDSSQIYLPGQPRMSLSDPCIGDYLLKEFGTKDLDMLAPHLWLVAKQDSSHISSLTHQIVRGRKIIITEKPGLHLVWYQDHVYIKPMPSYLMSHAFWEFYFGLHSPIPHSQRERIFPALLGFMRSYAYLIVHESDFWFTGSNSAPPLLPNVSYPGFVQLIMNFQSIQDDEVSQRYHYGELRLTRLNFWAKIFLRRFSYHKSFGQYESYFTRFYGPILFIFAIFSVLLSAMQVVIAVQQVLPSAGSWDVFAKFSRGFGVFSVLAVALVVLGMLLLLVVLILRETIYATKDLVKKTSARKHTAREKGILI